MSQTFRSVLLNTSTSSDVQYSGGEIRIAGLDTIKQSLVLNFSQINYRAERVQVITVGATSYTPTASTKYTVLIGDTLRTENGFQESLKPYSYVTPADITTLGATKDYEASAFAEKEAT